MNTNKNPLSKEIKKRSLLINFFVVFSSLVFCLLILLLGEALARIFSDVSFLGHSRDLFIANAYGTSKGNARNSDGISFGVKVYTDEHGFRISDNESIYQQDYEKSILILGDSVGFGPGVEAEKTFVGLLKNNLPLKIYNSSVVGYNTRDYRNVIDNFYLNHKNIDYVYLVFCLNDINSISATRIDEALGYDVGKNTFQADPIVASLKTIGILNIINEFLRTRSKLYLLIKGATTQPQRRYWEADYQIYEKATPNSMDTNLEPIAYIADVLRKHKVGFTVIIVPYEIQLRVKDEATRLPQKMLSDFFERKHIDYIDMIPFFNNKGLKSHGFLPYDAMHLSEAGHEVIFEIIKNTLE